LWFLGELELGYEFIATGGDAGGLDEPEYIGINPNAAVPTLVDDGLSIWESHAILRYLAAARAPDRFWPSDPAERSLIDRWMDWSQSQFDVSFMTLFWGHWRTPEADRKVKVNQFHADRCRRYLEILDGQLGDHEYVIGDRLSLADVPIGALMFRYANLDATEELPPNVNRWYTTLTGRAAYQAHIMMPFQDLKGRLAY
jgi:glutathione S-transferase